MCGRFMQNLLEKDIRDYFDAQATEVIDEAARVPRYNIGPGQQILVVRSNREQQRSLDSLHWGLIPHFASDRKGAYRAINARSESIERTAMYRAAFAKRRCLVVAHAFYEWRKEGKLKQPYAIAKQSGEPLALAGLWENWLDKSTGEWVRSVAIVTTAASAPLSRVHDRMPVLLDRASFARWLGEEPATVEQLKALLVPLEQGLELWPVDPRMNRVQVDEPSILEPVGEKLA
jgi:putative SOS response-associated peptidase YedK